MNTRRNHDFGGAPVRSLDVSSPSAAAKYQLMASLPGNMFHDKMASFVARYQCQVVDHSDDHVRLVFGSRSLLPWRPNRNDPRLELVVTLQRDTSCRHAHTHVMIDLIPLNSLGGSDLDNAYSRAICDLRASLLAQKLDRRRSAA